jgi:hypothetical protein
VVKWNHCVIFKYSLPIPSLVIHPEFKTFKVWFKQAAPPPSPNIMQVALSV